jgi:ArsR family transcriptional regulator, arsenate/arsenite/antimonite-responsive transcriptional repressor
MANYRNNWTVEYCLLALKALADENRLRALVALRSRELCQCQVVELLELAPSTVSKHLSILKQAGLIESRKVGRWIYFRAAETDSNEFQSQLAELISAHTKTTELIRADRRRIKEILCIDPECLCESQRTPR